MTPYFYFTTMSLQNVIPSHIVEVRDTALPVGKGSNLKNLNGNSFQGMIPYVELASGGGGGSSDFNGVTSNTAIVIEGTSYPIGTTLTTIISALTGSDVASIGYVNTTGILTLTSSNGGIITTTLSMEDDRTVTTTAMTIDGTVYPIGSNLNTVITALIGAELANGEFRGVFADATAVNAVTSPQIGDHAYVTNTNTLLNGSSGVGGNAYWTGAVWSVYQLSGTSDGGAKGSYANLTALNAAVTSPLAGDSAYLEDTVGVSGGASLAGGFVRYNAGAWSVYATLATTTADGIMNNTDFQKLAIQSLTDAATITWDANLGNFANVDIAANRTLATPTNTVEGELYVINVFAIAADRTITFNTVYKDMNGDDMGTITIPSGTARSFAFHAGPAVLHSIGYRPSTSISTYSATNGAIVTATGTGVTFARTSLTEWAFTVPDGVELLSGTIYSTTGQSPGSGCYIAFNNAGTRNYNNSTFGTDAKPPKIWGVNMFGNSDGTVVISRANAQPYAITTGATNLVPRISSVGTGDIEVELQNYTTALGSQASLVFFHFN
jgi:hypothetical protein